MVSFQVMPGDFLPTEARIFEIALFWHMKHMKQWLLILGCWSLSISVFLQVFLLLLGLLQDELAQKEVVFKWAGKLLKCCFFAEGGNR